MKRDKEIVGVIGDIFEDELTHQKMLRVECHEMVFGCDCHIFKVKELPFSEDVLRESRGKWVKIRTEAEIQTKSPKKTVKKPPSSGKLG